LVLGFLEVVAGGGDLGNTLGVDQIPVDADVHRCTHQCATGGTGWSEQSRGGVLEVVVVAQRRKVVLSGEVDGGVPSRDLSPKVRLGLVHLRSNRLQVGVVHLCQGFHLLQPQRTQLLDPNLGGPIGQRQGGGGEQRLERFGQLTHRRREHRGIGAGAIALELGGQGQSTGTGGGRRGGSVGRRITSSRGGWLSRLGGLLGNGVGVGRLGCGALGKRWTCTERKANHPCQSTGSKEGRAHAV
jgi:hypothetical protein